MSLWRCPTCQRVMRSDETASLDVAPILKPRGGGGVDQHSIGGTRRTCPAHPGVWLIATTRQQVVSELARQGGGHGDL